MMRTRNVSSLLAPLFLAVAFLAGCSDDPVGQAATGEATDLRITIDLAMTATAGVTVEVTAADLPDPLLFNLSVVDGVAAGTLTLPAGSERHITIRAFDVNGDETHRGSATMQVVEGSAEALTIELEPLGSEIPLEATIGVVTLIVRGPDGPLVVGDTFRMIVHVIDAAGDTVDTPVHWGTLDPDRLTVNRDGVVTALETGQASVSAIFAGVAAAQTLRISTPLAIMLENIQPAFGHTWWDRRAYNGMFLGLSAAADQHTSVNSNAMMLAFNLEPRQPVQNDGFSGNLRYNWESAHGTLVQTAYALRRLEDLAPILDESGADVTELLRFWGRLSQGYAMATVAQLYDYGFIITESSDPEARYGAANLKPYSEVMDTALALLQDAADQAAGGSFTVPAEWAGTTLTTEDAIRVTRSLMARFRATVARTPEEREAVDWDAVIADVDAGITEDFLAHRSATGWYSEGLYYANAPDWSYRDMRFAGQADTTYTYEAWMSAPVEDRSPGHILSPDLRFPTASPQPGSHVLHYEIDPLGASCCFDRGRGTYLLSYYVDRRPLVLQTLQGTETFAITIAHDEMRLLEAEGLYRTGELDAAAALVNETREAVGGLPPVDASGTTSSRSCVPRVFDGEIGAPSSRCGDLWDALKYEKRNQVYHTTLGDWFFDQRGWGDLVEGTPVQLPLPAPVAYRLGMAPYTYGGVGGNCGAGAACVVSPVAGGTALSLEQLDHSRPAPAHPRAGRAR